MRLFHGRAWLWLPLILLAGCQRPAQEVADEADEIPVYVSLPDFSLTERSGSVVTLADLGGQVWVADFIFTNCSGPCPLLSSQMANLQRALRDTPGVRLVSFSVDPQRDTPDVLSQYARHFGADSGKWLFLTGEKEKLYTLIHDGFKLGVGDGSTAAGHGGPELITHSTRFVLVDQQGRIRKYYMGTEKDAVEQIVPDVRRLLQGSAPSGG
jgi:cytochrome oxidase Cu insertion factor (SCO1/SenC/PrrC family)